MLRLPGDTDSEYMELLFPFAYNILGSAEDAKDAVQDVVLKFYSIREKDIVDQRNYLIRAVINTAINIKSKKQNLQPGGLPWLPEPIVTDDTADKSLLLHDVLSYSLLVLMERLNAKERAIFILKETFDYSHAEIAAFLDISEEHSRKLLSRAKASLFKPARRKTEKEAHHEREVISRFMNAIRKRDIQQLENAMTADIRFYADGGGKVPLLATKSRGSAEIATLVIKAYYNYLQSAQFCFVQVNHQPALLTYRNGELNSCLVFDLQPETDRILQISAVMDPAKLRSLLQRPLIDGM